MSMMMPRQNEMDDKTKNQQSFIDFFATRSSFVAPGISTMAIRPMTSLAVSKDQRKLAERAEVQPTLARHIAEKLAATRIGGEFFTY